MDCLDEQLRTIAGWTKDDLQLHSIVDNNRFTAFTHFWLITADLNINTTRRSI